MRESKYSTKATIDKIRKSMTAKELIPMGYTPGLPILTIKSGYLCMMIPFLKYQVTGKVDQTFVFPIKYVITVSVPEGIILSCEDLAINKSFSSVKFDAPVGVFRHEAIKTLDKRAYMSMRGVLLSCYDAIVAHLTEKAPYDKNDDNKFRKLLNVLLEPSLKIFYKTLDADFANKYIEF